jgi:glycosyltransferase involved in cell wall biosynthesis
VHFVLVTSSFPIRGDGSEAAGSFVVDLAEELAKHIDVCVVAPGVIGEREQWSQNVLVHRYAAPARPLSTLKPWRPRDVRWIMRVWRGGLKATREALAGGDAGVVALWALPCGEWARRATRERDSGYSVWVLGSDVWSLGRIPILRGKLARVVRKADHAYADGYKLAEDTQRIAGVPVAFLPSTRRLELSDPRPPRDRPPYQLLFLGRWHPNKGVDLLLDALALLDEKDWQRIRCVEIQGGGPLEPLVRQRVAALRATGRPVEAGRFLTKPEAEAAIVRADWVVIPSRVESTPVVFSDAMKLHRPVIATSVGDLGRLLSQTPAGMLAERPTARGFAQGLSKALASSAAEKVIGTEVLASQFDLAVIAERLLANCVTTPRKATHDNGS